MSKPVNLNQIRKARTRAADKVQADRNAVTFGLPKSTRQLGEAAKDAGEKHLDQHRLDPKR
ncbi:MAG: DUF4169 family protein [Marinosulfonomonas sp.]|nr:DUF4169 family protein [Marinosulfonomonas sp.]